MWPSKVRRVGEVLLLDITTDLGIPTVLAYTPPGSGRDHHGRGLESSLSEQHAVYRALSELLQIELLGTATAPERLHALGALDPILLRCAEFDLTEQLPHSVMRPVAPHTEPGPVAAQLATVTRAVRTRGFTPYCHALDTGTDTLSLVHLVVPGLERIMTLLQGHPALPGPRGFIAARAAHGGAPIRRTQTRS